MVVKQKLLIVDIPWLFLDVPNVGEFLRCAKNAAR